MMRALGGPPLALHANECPPKKSAIRCAHRAEPSTTLRVVADMVQLSVCPHRRCAPMSAPQKKAPFAALMGQSPAPPCGWWAADHGAAFGVPPLALRANECTPKKSAVRCAHGQSPTPPCGWWRTWCSLVCPHRRCAPMSAPKEKRCSLRSWDKAQHHPAGGGAFLSILVTTMAPISAHLATCCHRRAAGRSMARRLRRPIRMVRMRPCPGAAARSCF